MVDERILWFFVAACFMSSTCLQSEAAPIGAVPGETTCNHPIADNMTTVHEHFSNSVDQFSDHRESHPALDQFEVYKRGANLIASRCDDLELPVVHPIPTPTPSSLVCPYELVCRQYTDTYPYVFYEARCSSLLDNRAAFGCKEVTYPLKVLRKYPCGDGQFRWGWNDISITTACVAYGADSGYKTLEDTALELNLLSD